MSMHWSFVIVRKKNDDSDNSSSEEDITEEQRAKREKYLTILKKWLVENTENKNCDEQLLFYMNYFLRSPRKYLMCKDTLRLPFPPLEELKEIEMNFEPAVSEDLMQHLSKRLKHMPAGTKLITLGLDKMALTKDMAYNMHTDKIIGFVEIDGNRTGGVATDAYLAVLSSCTINHRQPLSYAFTKHDNGYSEISKWVDKLIRNLHSCGFVVCAVVSSFNDLANFKGVTIEKPYFEVDGNKIFYIIDPQAVMMSIRDTLIETNLFFDDDKLISWSDIVDVQMQHRILSKAHVNPTPEQKRSWALAAPIFDLDIAELIAAKYQPEVSGTAQFITMARELCEIIVEVGILNEPVYAAAPEQIETFDAASAIFKSIKLPESVQSETIDMSCFTNVQITINAFKQLFEQLIPQGLNCLLSRKFNSDAMNHFKREICKMSKMNEPTAQKFQWAFSKMILVHLIYNSLAFDCDEDLEPYILSGTFVNLFQENFLPTG